MPYEVTFMQVEGLSGRWYVEKLTQQGAALMKDTDWVLGDLVWAVIGVAVVLGLMLLNAYVQRLARIEELQRIELLNRQSQQLLDLTTSDVWPR
jgi:hypothetical protein